MHDYRLSSEELAELRAAHRKMRDIREAYRINAVILLGQGRGVKDVADALLMDPETVRSYFKRYQKGGIDELLRMSYVGSEALLGTHLQEHVYQSAAEVARYVEQRWGVRYTASGMTALLRRLGYRYKKPHLQPGKHPPVEDQRAWVEQYQNLKETKAPGDVVVFMDAAHPQHNPVLSGGWIKRGKRHTLQSNTGRQRLNINGAINIETLQLTDRFDETIDAVSTIALLRQLEQAYPEAPRIIVFCDNARYYKSKRVAEYLETSRIQLEPLPPYSPNLNLIERFWKFFIRNILYNRYYERFQDFRDASNAFLSGLDVHVPRLRTLMTENFQIVGN